MSRSVFSRLSSGSQSNTDAPPTDPLLTDGVIKEKRLIVVKGPYVGLLNMLGANHALAGD